MTDSSGTGLGGNLKLAAVAVLAVVAIGWVVMQLAGGNEEVPVPPTRSVRSFVVDWECLGCGHRFRQNAGPGAQPCPKCNQPKCYAMLTWTCRQHGDVRVAFQYDEEGNPIEVRVAGGEWQPAMNEHGGWTMDCPKCGGPLSPVK